MMSLSEQLYKTCETIAEQIQLPKVKEIYLPLSHEQPCKTRKFGLVILDDNSTGFFFNLLTESKMESTPDYPQNTIELAAWFLQTDIDKRAIGLGAIGAITRHLFDRAGYIPDTATNPMADFNFTSDDHVGMIGYFPRLVDQLRSQGTRLTVLELDDQFVQKADRFIVSTNPASLGSCNKVLCTASTLINNTVDEILDTVSNAERVAIIGPSASCIPEALFNRGISVLGGTRVNQYDSFREHCESGTDWRHDVSKYCIEPHRYPGTNELLKRALSQST